ncbi:MFS transporter [Sphingobium sp.]|uniref:MFS transporter n=1 Tax=Sphingobium sp. TaxID=1912891 RepID=UPI003BB62EE7
MTSATMNGAAADRLPVKLCLGFGVGTVGVSIMLNTVTAYFPAFCSTVLGKSPEIAGYLLMISKLYDVLADIAVGMMSDRTRSRWGRRRPYLLAGALVSALSFLMIFAPPEMSDGAITLYMLAALVLYSTGYTLFNVPYMTMPSEMTASRYERSRLLSFRTVFVSIGQLLAVAATASIISAGGGGRTGYMVMGVVMALIIFSAMAACFFGTAKARQLEATRPEIHADAGQIRLLLRNRPFMLLVGAKIFQFLAFASTATTTLLFMLNVLGVGYTGQMIYSMSANLVVAASMPLWLWLERRFGKRNAYLVGIAVMCAVSVSWLLTGKDVTTAELLIRGVIFGFGSGGMILLSISMLGDTMAYDRELTGQGREGLLSSVIAMIEKIAFAGGVVVVGIYLKVANYVPTRNGALVEQPESAVHALYICYALIPVGLFLLNALCIWFYTLGGRQPAPAVIDPEPAGF